MSLARLCQFTVLALVGVGSLTGLSAAPGVAQLPPSILEERGSGPAWTVDASADVSNRYLFRGHEKDEGGLIVQPALAATLALGAADGGLLRSWSVSGFAWSSLHAGTRVQPDRLGLYELDLGATFEAELAGGHVAELVYTAYLAPTGAFAHIHELGLGLILPTLGLEHGVNVTPTLLLARELHDGAGPNDTYLEVGGDIGLPPTGMVNWAIPVRAGFSVNGFYRDAAGENEWFGHVQAGIATRAALDDLGIAWRPGSLEAGLTMAFDNPEAGITSDPREEVLWTFRIGVRVEER